MQKEIILASNNKNKLREMKELLEELGINVISQSEAGIELDVEETGSTFKENSHLKAKAIYDASKKATFADDSGLEVDALNGEPGIYSARYAGENATDEDKRKKVLNLLSNVEDPKRTARFICSICYIDEQGKEHYFQRSSEGKILKEERGNNGFGYDPIFLYTEDENNNKTFAEMTDEEKNAVSHRGRAVRDFVDYLRKNIQGA